MDIVISPSSDYPIYRQIEENIKTEILNHKLEKNTLLPYIRQLACDLNVSVITVKKAYEELEHSGFIYSFPGKGFYVSEMSENQIDIIKKKIAANTLQKQIEYLKSLGVEREDILSIIKENLSCYD